MRARLKAQGDLATMVGWHVRNLKFVRNLKSLPEYLKPPPTPEGRREQGARDVKRMLDRMIKQQEAAGGAE